jgi:hypothetical protein
MRSRVQFSVVPTAAAIAVMVVTASARATPEIVPTLPASLPTGGVSPFPSPIAPPRRPAPKRRSKPVRPGRYINPFADPGWLDSRIDMGVDWTPLRRLPVLAIGDGVILGADGHRRWPGGHIIWYELTNGDHAGDIIFVAEHLTRLLAVGTRVRAGQPIAIALPGYPWTEWGWADANGSPRSAPCYREGQRTNSGKQMARFLQSLGAQLVWDPPGPGTNQPSGRRC